jgi:uncharacterized protein YjbI with pentapeptide repeats
VIPDTEGIAPGPGVQLSGRELGYANLQSIDLSAASFQSSNFTYVHLYDSTLTGANLTGANLTNADLMDATLTGANLAGAIVAGATSFSPLLTGSPSSNSALRRVTGKRTSRESVLAPTTSAAGT